MADFNKQPKYRRGQLIKKYAFLQGKYLEILTRRDCNEWPVVLYSITDNAGEQCSQKSVLFCNMLPRLDGSQMPEEVSPVLDRTPWRGGSSDEQNDTALELARRRRYLRRRAREYGKRGSAVQRSVVL